jgi:PAS domain S-box-containing protein
LTEDATGLEVVYLTFEPDKAARLEQALGLPALGHRIPLGPGSPFQQVLSTGEPVLTDSGGKYAATALPEDQERLAAEARAIMGVERSLLVAMGSGEETHGILAVSGSDLDPTEGQAVATFADQAAVALSNARLLEEVQSWAAELELRVEERTADLAATEARYRRLFNTNRDALYVLDQNGHCLDSNPAAGQLLGYDQEELSSLNLFQLGIELQEIPAEEHARFVAQIEQAWREGLAGYETVLLQKGGGLIPVEVSVTPLAYEGQTAALTAVRDISERKRAETALKASRAKMQLLAHQVISAQEQERQRLAGTLHDEAGQALTALKIGLELIEKDVPPDLSAIRSRLADMGNLAEATLEGIRKMAQDLRPPALDRVGLSPTLESFCRDFAQHTQLNIHYQGTELPLLAEPVTTTLYRFLQEALANVARHAGADEVRVALRRDAESISLSVDDDGQGFETMGDGPPGLGMGLAGMRERLQSLNGWLVLESQPGQGTHLTAQIPLEEAHLATEAS